MANQTTKYGTNLRAVLFPVKHSPPYNKHVYENVDWHVCAETASTAKL